MASSLWCRFDDLLANGRGAEQSEGREERLIAVLCRVRYGRPRQNPCWIRLLEINLYFTELGTAILSMAINGHCTSKKAGFPNQGGLWTPRWGRLG